MIYVTFKLPKWYRQMSLEDFLFKAESSPIVFNENETDTRTYAVDSVSPRLRLAYGNDVPTKLYNSLVSFNDSTESLRAEDRHALYREFYIPKKSGGLRKIDAPQPELMDALRRLKTIFEEVGGILYHTSAFAYIKRRSTLDAVKRHQANESKWFAKYDLHDFFGSTTLDFVLKMFSMVYPFSELMTFADGRQVLSKALELAFLDGGLPQGTPISPLITNTMMIPIDFILSKTLREYDDNRFVYTRYADDFIISSKYDFSSKNVEKLIISTLQEYNAPFSLNTKKTRYGSSAGRNWNLGVMLNKDNKITIGHKKKRQFQAMLSSYVMDRKNGKPWAIQDIQVMEGYRNYYRMVEGETIDGIVNHIGEKFGVDICKMIKQDLSTY